MVLCAEKDIWHKAISRRQQVMQEHESMARTAFQMSAELVSLKASVLRKSVVIDLFFPDFLRGFLASSSLQAMLESVENRRLQDSEVAALVKTYPITTAKTSANSNGGIFTEWNFTAAGHVMRQLGSDDEVLEVIRVLESKHGLDSCLNSLVKLEKLATKPSGKAARRWIFQMLLDHLEHGLAENEDISKKALLGDKHTAGLVVLWEWKMKLLNYICDTLMLQAKISETDREAIKSRCRDCPSMRQACEDSVQWQASMSRSGQEALRFFQDVVFLKTFDNLLRGICKGVSTNPEVVLELDSINERWQQVIAMRQNELAQNQAKEAELSDGEDSQDEEALLTEARKAPNTLKQGSPSYWRAVANKSVRMYLTFVTEGKNDSQLQLQVSQWQAATGLQPEIGKKTLLVHLDTALLGESSGPHCQAELRGKRWKPAAWLNFFWDIFSVKESTLRFQNFHIIERLLTEDIDLVEKLAACPCIALGAQSVEKVRCSVPAEGVVVAVVDPLSVGPKLFKEASKQSVWLMFNEKSVRERKQIVRAGAYSQQMLCNLYSEKPLSLTMPEVERKIYPGFSHGDVIGYISCLGPSKLWRVPRLVVLSFSCLSCQI